MRISDWSSDVCSSDLAGLDVFQTAGEINDREITYVVIHRVDGEIATKRIGFKRAVFVVGQDAAGLVALVAGGDLDTDGHDLAARVAVPHLGNGKTPTYQCPPADDSEEEGRDGKEE